MQLWSRVKRLKVNRCKNGDASLNVTGTKTFVVAKPSHTVRLSTGGNSAARQRWDKKLYFTRQSDWK